MENRFDQVLNSEAFKNIEPEKIGAMKEMAREIEGKSMPEVVAVFTKYSRILSQGRPIEKQEQDLMLQVILSAMPEEEQKKYAPVIKMIRSGM